MSLCLWITRRDFGHRLCISVGAAEAFRTENWLCAARVLLTVCCYAWIKWGAPEPAHQFRLALLAGTYVLFSLLALALLHLHRKADALYGVTTLAIDLLFAVAITSYSGGPESPYWVLGVFAAMTAAYRWGVRKFAFTVGASTLLFVAEGVTFHFWPRYLGGAGPGDLNRPLLRGALFALASLGIGFLAIRERRLRAESALVARILGRVQAGRGLEQAMTAILGEIATLYLPLKALAALRMGKEQEVFSWEMPDPVSKPQFGTVKTLLQFSRLEAEAFSFPAHTWYYSSKSTRSGRLPRLLALDTLGRRVQASDSVDLLSYLSADEVGPVMVTSFSQGEECNARLILIWPSLRGDAKAALRFLQRLMKQVGPALLNVCSLRNVRKQAEDQIRARLTRELHDVTIQSLLGAEMQIEVLRRQNANLNGELERRLAGLQSLMHRETLNLRDLIEETKPLNFAPKELPDFLAVLVGRFRRETGISVRMETEENVTLLPRVCHEIVRIVQEGLTNVRKHSGARNVVITLRKDEDGQHRLVIADDGNGFGFRGRVTQKQLDTAHRGPGVIKQRVQLIGGEMAIDSLPGHGARLEITIPDEAHG